MDKESVIDALRALTSEMQNRTKIAQLREVYPYIEEAKRAGFKNAKIVETLNAQGFGLTLKSFEMLLYRIREQQREVTGDSTKTSALPMPPLTRRSQDVYAVDPPSEQSQLGVLDKKQQRERLADQFISPEITNPLLKRLKEHQK